MPRGAAVAQHGCCEKLKPSDRSLKVRDQYSSLLLLQSAPACRSVLKRQPITRLQRIAGKVHPPLRSVPVVSLRSLPLGDMPGPANELLARLRRCDHQSPMTYLSEVSELFMSSQVNSARQHRLQSEFHASSHSICLSKLYTPAQRCRSSLLLKAHAHPPRLA